MSLEAGLNWVTSEKEADYLIKQAKKYHILDKDELLMRSLQRRVDSRGRLRDFFGRMVRIPDMYSDIQRERYRLRRRATYHKKRGNIEKFEQNLNAANKLKNELFSKIEFENNSLARSIKEAIERKKSPETVILPDQRWWRTRRFRFAAAGVAALVAVAFKGMSDHHEAIQGALAANLPNAEKNNLENLNIKTTKTQDGKIVWHLSGYKSTPDRISKIDELINKKAQENNPPVVDSQISELVQLSLNTDKEFERVWEKDYYGN